MGPAHASQFVSQIYSSMPELTIDQLSTKILSYPNYVSSRMCFLSYICQLITLKFETQYDTGGGGGAT